MGVQSCGKLIHETAMGTKLAVVILMTFFPSGTQPERKYYSSLHKLTSTIPERNRCSTCVCTHFKPAETFHYTHFSSCHQYGVKRWFNKGEALRILRTNSSKTPFEEKKLQITPSRKRDQEGCIQRTLCMRSDI